MEQKYYRDAYVEIDLDKIYENYKSIKHLQNDKTFIAVVKSNAYGHGAQRVSQFLESKGVDFFAVGTLDEAIELRMSGVKSKILVLGMINPININKAIQHRVAVTAPSLEWIEDALRSITGEYNKNVWIHIKVNSCMNRYGTDDVSEIKQMIEKIHESEHFVYEGIFSHLALASTTYEGSKKEFDKFKNIAEQVEQPRFVHCLNSAGTMLFEENFTNATRIGIALYGYYPSNMVKNQTNVNLKPALRLITQVVEQHHLQTNEFVGYDKTFIAKKPTNVVTIPIGYGDGVLRKHSGYTVNVAGEDCQIVGRVCMDAIMIESDAKIGDEVIVIDDDFNSQQSLERFSDYVDTISHESICLLTKRLPRIYKNGAQKEISNEILK